MIRIAAAFVLLAAAGASAQEPVPDPTPPHLYYPLGVGDVREYEECDPGPFPWGCWEYRYYRHVIDREVVEDGTRYVVEVIIEARAGEPWPASGVERLLRYDSTLAIVVERLPGGREVYESCQLDADFGALDDQACGMEVVRGDEATSRTGGAVKEYLGMEDGITYEAGIGRVYRSFWGWSQSLTYASVGGGVVGVKRAVTADAGPETASLTLTASPNPTAGPLALAVDVPSASAMTLEAFDALGRRVWHREVTFGAGRQRVEVDAGLWARGLYVVRAMTEGVSATAAVVRR